jgi:hypothetical protein
MDGSIGHIEGPGILKGIGQQQSRKRGSGQAFQRALERDDDGTTGTESGGGETRTKGDGPTASSLQPQPDASRKNKAGPAHHVDILA